MYDQQIVLDTISRFDTWYRFIRTSKLSCSICLRTKYTGTPEGMGKLQTVVTLFFMDRAEVLTEVSYIGEKKRKRHQQGIRIWGRGKVDPIGLKKKSPTDFFCDKSSRDRFESIRNVRSSSILHGMFPLGYASEAIHRCLGLFPDENHRCDKSQTSTSGDRANSRPRPRTVTDRSTAYPGGGSSKKKTGGRKPNSCASSVSQAPRESSDRSKHGGKAKDFDSCIAVAVPCMAFEDFLRPSKRS